MSSDDDTLPTDSALHKWFTLSIEASVKLGRRIDSGKRYKEQLEAAGFVDVVETRYKWPQNGWPKDKKFKELGRKRLLFLPGLVCIRLLNRY